MEMRCPWQRSLIIKVMGRSISFTYLLNQIKSLWKPMAEMVMIALDNDYFLVKFTSWEDYAHAKFEGTWMIMYII